MFVFQTCKVLFYFFMYFWFILDMKWEEFLLTMFTDHHAYVYIFIYIHALRGMLIAGSIALLASMW